MKQNLNKVWNETLTFLAILFLCLFSYPAFDAEISTATQSNLDALQITIWAVFALDLIYGISRAENKIAYLKKHPLEIASVLLPFLRPLRLMRVISFAGLAIQKIAIGRQFAITFKVLLTTVFITYVSAVQITVSERSSTGSNIRNFGDGLWWAITTVTTVGYGDRFPTTVEGKFLAVFLMMMGISLVGVITASVAAWFVRLSSIESENN